MYLKSVSVFPVMLMKGLVVAPFFAEPTICRLSLLLSNAAGVEMEQICVLDCDELCYLDQSLYCRL